MLNDISVEIGNNLATIFKNQKVNLGCTPSSLLEELTSSISNSILTLPTRQVLIPEAVVGSSLGATSIKNGVSTYVRSHHDVIMDNYIDDIKNLISNHISFARNVVNKEVSKLSEAISTSLTSYKFKEPEDFFEIFYFKLDPIFSSYLVTSEVIGFTNAASGLNTINLNSVMNEVNFIDYLCIGDEEEDQVIRNWASSLGEELIKNYICIVNDSTRLDIDEMLNYNLANYLFYRNLTARTDLNVGLNLANLRLSASKNRDYFAFACKNAIALYDNYLKQDKLLLNKTKINFSYMSSSDIKLKIFEENFVKFSEQGGSLEVLFGYVSSNSSIDVTTKYLLDNKDKLYNNWTSVRNMYAMYLSNKKIDTYKDIITDCFRLSMVELTDAEKEIYINKDMVLSVQNAGYKYISELKLENIDKIEDIALELVAKYRFGFSNSYEILSEMKAIMIKDSNIEPMEAALLSSIKLVTRYLLDQVVKL